MLNLRFSIKIVVLIAIEVTAKSGSAQINHIQEMSVWPINPDTSTITKLIVKTSLPTSPCYFDSSKVSLLPGEIWVKGYFHSGGMQTPCVRTDTITIGKLPQESLTVFYHVRNDLNIVLDTDSINSSQQS